MSWFARSITNTFLPDPSSTPPAETQPGSDSEPDSASPKGVKEDISELTKTLTRQLWGVASFLAPPPQSHPNPTDSDPDESETSGIDGIRSDFAEIGGRFRSEISKIASEFFREEEEGEEGEEVVGVTEEVLAFARNIAMHPETWLDFPLLPEEDESDDFDMSNAQQEHALAVEHLAPRLAALRIELCPSHMSEGCFWKIYFVLLHPRLNKEDAERLSTPQVVEARAMLLQDLQKRTKSRSFVSGSSMSQGKESESPSPSAEQKEVTVSQAPPLEEPTTTSSASPDTGTDKHPVVTTEIKIVDKSVIEEEVPKQTNSPSSDASKVPIERYEDDADDWLQEDEGTEIDRPNITPIPIGNEDDVSFSDLEDDDDQIAPSSSQKGSHSGSSQLKDSKDWIELNKGSCKSSGDKRTTIPKNESNEWLDVDDIDLA